MRKSKMLISGKSILNGKENYDSIKKWSYSIAKQWVIENLIPKGVTSSRKFFNYIRTNSLPKHFPRRPDDFFRYRGHWKGWDDFLGYPSQKRKSSKFCNYETAKKLAQEAEIESCKEYREWEDKPSTLPSRPELTYKDEWVSWKDFLGENYKRNHRVIRNYTKLSEADVRIIKHQINLGVTGAFLAKHFGVSEMQISRIRHGENWNEI